MNKRKTVLRKPTISSNRLVVTLALGVCLACFLTLVISGFLDAYPGPNGSFGWPIFWEKLSTSTALLLLSGVLCFGTVLYVTGSGRRWNFLRCCTSSGGAD